LQRKQIHYYSAGGLSLKPDSYRESTASPSPSSLIRPPPLNIHTYAEGGYAGWGCGEGHDTAQYFVDLDPMFLITAGLGSGAPAPVNYSLSMAESAQPLPRHSLATGAQSVEDPRPTKAKLIPGMRLDNNKTSAQPSPSGVPFSLLILKYLPLHADTSVQWRGST
jgi:hypothetical protein